MQRRRVHCVSQPSGEQLHDRMCRDKKPEMDKTCSANKSCVLNLHHIHGKVEEDSVYGWVAGGWGRVSVVSLSTKFSDACRSARLAVEEDTSRGPWCARVGQD